MTKDEVYGVTRSLLSAVGGFAVARGWLDAETAVMVGGALATLIAAMWSVKSKRPHVKE